MYVLLQWRAQKCMNPANDVRGKPRHTKITLSPQFRTSDQHEVTRGLRRPLQNLHFTTVFDVRWARNDERVVRRHREFAFHHSFGGPTSTKWREGCDGDLQNSHFTTVLETSDEHECDERVATKKCKLRISPQFWTSDEHEVTRGLRGPCSKFAFHHSFGRPTSTKWREGGLPSWPTKPTLRKKRKEILKKSWSTAILSRSSQQIFSAQLFSADLLSRSSQHSHSQQIFSAISTAILSRSSQHSHSQQIFSAEPFSADLLSYHVAVVRGWWSAIVSSFAVVRGWWSAIVWSAIVLSFAVVRGLVVSYCLIMLVVNTARVL